MRISYKNLKRYREISHILIKYGFSFIVEKLNIEEVAQKIYITKPSEDIKNMSTAKKIRCAIEELTGRLSCIYQRRNMEGPGPEPS